MKTNKQIQLINLDFIERSDIMNNNDKLERLLTEIQWEEDYYGDMYDQLTDYIMSMRLPQAFEARLLSAVADVFGY